MSFHDKMVLGDAGKYTLVPLTFFFNNFPPGHNYIQLYPLLFNFLIILSLKDGDTLCLLKKQQANCRVGERAPQDISCHGCIVSL